MALTKITPVPARVRWDRRHAGHYPSRWATAS